MTDQAPHARDLATVLAEFSQVMLEDDPSAERILERLGEYCTELLPVHGVGVLLRNPNGDLEVVTANTEAGSIVEKAEAELREGPCSEALATGEQVAAPNLAEHADRWPRFVPIALEAGVRAIHGLPLSVRGETIGSLDLVATEELNLTAKDIATAQMVGDVTLAYLVNSRSFAEKSVLAAQLQRALDSRIVIEQAKGKVSERHGITVSDAFEMLRRYARNNGLKLHDVAGAVVRGDLQL